MAAHNDEAIVRAVRSGRTEAFADLVDRHKEGVYGVLMRLTADSQVAEELAHETFVRAYQGLKTFRGESRFGTWLTRIAINLARDHVREMRRSRTVSLDAALEQDPDSLTFAEQVHGNPLSEVDARDLLERLEGVLQEMPPLYREAFVLHHVEDMPYEDMAAVTGDSVGSLKVRVHRARKLLRERLLPGTRQSYSEDAEG
jgi:RNA polymerase sigma-70 factor (ECF subfamily)